MVHAEADARQLVTRFDPNAADYDRISLEQAQAMLAASRGARFVTITALTVPEYRRRGCPYAGNLFKLARVNGVINWQYEAAVNRQRVREDKTPDFESLPRRWGSHLNHTPFVSHVTKSGQHKLYLKYKLERVLSVEYRTEGGDPIPLEEIQPFLKEREPNYRQGVDKEILERDYTITNIISIVIDGRGYVITV